MKIDFKSGKYVAAVSGGVDSVVLLDVLKKLPGMELIVAHFDHGIREDSAEDRRFVQRLADKCGLPFEYAEGRLGSQASEAVARAARYDFLTEVMEKHQAQAIVTAHHEDDALETAIINLLRGTGRKGLSALGTGGKVERPFLHIPKQDIVQYAESHGLEWREDSTNQEEVYLRNYIRRRLLSGFSNQDRQRLLRYIKQSKSTNKKLDELLDNELRRNLDKDDLDRRWFNSLPHAVALEAMAAWLRQQAIRGFDRKTLERLVVAAKTGRPGQRFDVMKGVTMGTEKDSLALTGSER